MELVAGRPDRPTSLAPLAALGFMLPPDGEGWYRRDNSPVGRFDDHFRRIRFRVEHDRVRFRLDPDMTVTNMNGVVHGAYILGFVDYALFVAPAALGIERVVGGATIEASTQFYAPVQADRPVDMVAEVMRETGRMVFSRGVVEQDGRAVAGYSGTIRKRNTAEAAERLEQFTRLRG